MDGDYCWADGKSVSTYDRSQNYIYDGLMVKIILRMGGGSPLVMVNDHVGKDDMDDMMMNVVFQSQLTSSSDRKTPSPLPAPISSSLAR